MDIVSWDNYPAYNTPWSLTAMHHDLMRGLKDAPFLLMEQTPSQQNWQPYNSLKRPGQMRHRVTRPLLTEPIVFSFSSSEEVSVPVKSFMEL